MIRVTNIRAAYWIVLVLVLCAAPSCSKDDQTTKEQNNADWQNKIAFDLSQIRPDGLTGPPDGLVSVSYEFCIPKDKAFLDEVLAVDPAIKSTPESPGRIGCGKTEYLCIGDTHNPRWKDILRQLASLDYVTRIERTYWE
jgi:hypothetical protein